MVHLTITVKTQKDLLVERALPYSSGFATVMINEGSLLNKGFEFSLNADIIRSNGWKWNVGGNIGFNKTTIENLGLEVSDIGSLKGVRGYLGKTIGDHFGPANILLKVKLLDYFSVIRHRELFGKKM